MVGRSDVGRRPESLRRVEDEVAEETVGEVDLRLAGALALQADAAVAEGFAHRVAPARFADDLPRLRQFFRELDQRGDARRVVRMAARSLSGGERSKEAFPISIPA